MRGSLYLFAKIMRLCEIFFSLCLNIAVVRGSSHLKCAAARLLLLETLYFQGFCRAPLLRIAGGIAKFSEFFLRIPRERQGSFLRSGQPFGNSSILSIESISLFSVRFAASGANSVYEI